MYNVKKYNEELFTTLFGVTNKIAIKKIRFWLDKLLSKAEKNNICAKLYRKIRNLDTKNIISNKVSCFIKLL